MDIGEEFSAIFLSTVEPTDEYGNSQDPVRSINHELVFNTVMTRSKCLVYCIGNPFVLNELGMKYRVNCWAEYLFRCIQCGTLQFPRAKTDTEIHLVEQAARQLKDRVFPLVDIEKATTVKSTSNVDDIIMRYMSKVSARREYSISCKLVQSPKGKLEWEREEETLEENVVLCRLDFKNFIEAKAVPVDPSEPSTTIKGKVQLKGALPGDIIKIDRAKNCVLFDKETEEAIKETHFGHSFLCRVSSYSSIQFYPLDKCYPKFVNLPLLTKQEKENVVCFDPRSIDSIPKVSNIIPHNVALEMFFVVKFLGWRKEFNYPMGIIIAAIPSKSIIWGDLLLKMMHKIPLSTPKSITPVVVAESCAISKKVFTHAITIDPKGSLDHDDAITCNVTQCGDVEKYTVGVHITNVEMFLPKDSELDELAASRGCTVYNAPDSVASPMLPDGITERASILPNKEVNAFAVLTSFTVNKKIPNDIKVADVSIIETKVTSQAELTYSEAQALLFQDEEELSPTLLGKMQAFKSSQPLPLNQMVRHLWKLAWFLRRERLKNAALAFTVKEEDHLQNPEAHYLVEEFMIWANRKVAEELVGKFPHETIIRSQAKPNDQDLEEFKENFKAVIPLSAAFNSLICPDQLVFIQPLLILKSVYRAFRNHLQESNARAAMHCIHFEHYHPQLAALHSVVKFIQAPAKNTTPKGDSGQQHWSLQCKLYTHFTSPLRRYIDVVIQRQLSALLRKKPNMYDKEELAAICDKNKTKQKEAREYETNVTSLALANSLIQCSKEYDCFVTKVEPQSGKLSFCFSDMELQKCRSNNISLQHLQIHQTVKEKQSDTKYVWKVKICSIDGKAVDILNQDEIEELTERPLQLSMYSTDDSHCHQGNKVHLGIRSKVDTIPSNIWRDLQQCTMEGEHSFNSKANGLLKKSVQSSGHLQQPVKYLNNQFSLCIYNLNRPIILFEAMKVQLSASRLTHMLEPTIQLLEVGPGLKICVQHNKNAMDCFVGRLTANASRPTYNSLDHYIKSWEPLIIAEAAYSGVKESEFLLIKGVKIQWPSLQCCVSSSGESYYKMIGKEGAHFDLPPNFIQSSFRFFKMSKGDLACVRFTSNDCSVKYVFHMLIDHVEIDDVQRGGQICLKFVWDDKNYISQKVHKALPGNTSYEIQLIPLSFSHR